MDYLNIYIHSPFDISGVDNILHILFTCLVNYVHIFDIPIHNFFSCDITS